MFIRYTKADPSGNITALVEAFPSVISPAETSARVFAADSSIEQLGFLSKKDGADIALTMAGGEFCGNACLCAAAFHLQRSGSSAGRVRVAISGAENCIEVEMEKDDEGYRGTVEMPLPLSISRVDTPCGSFPLVRFPGIQHVIAPAALGRDAAENLIVPLCTSLKAEALGIMLYDESCCALTPLVYVPAADTLYWEHSCASGTSALGAWKSSECGGSCRLEFSQPGGSLSINAITENAVLTHLRLGGKVALGESISLKI